ncbi:sphingosine 1-phosphate receptor 1 [Callorhinchus milii]|uniref:Sphingosine 1-phosphate receptor 1-like protein n=1 Tax=Callorhinchus milii TaxID=7868 RepID=V9KJQ5_CALMI|nr:sphingosine 1-phosphate receptor 1 [Callorhinchus milii]XP_007907179.1 sphingosine 1-phosphate receptor 1 [Callorhinchus milii]XP_007907180.1 sphingosine 1-phosphate receptor 1 [Callorhinchus milii]XP_042191783.1 sphingosine 1-phosphate receptor 1 [Callorhinchus milii]|eukprot:gi/632980696/ref/XP_007907178.1/ PREDICTED: sphingosine 1-phosphate receptor 1 [Callorhinchus milii]
MEGAMYRNASSHIIVDHYNFTGKLKPGRPEAGLKVASILFIVVCCFIILENLMVLLAIWQTKKFHRAMYYFIGNLALSDLLAGAAYTINILLSGSNTFSLTPTQWFVREGSMFVALAASVLSLFAIAIERYLTMLKMKPHSTGSTYRVFLLISGCWLLSLALGGLPIMGWNCISDLPSCSTVLPLYHKHYILFCTSVLSVILMAIVLLYARIYLLVRARSLSLTFRKYSMRSSKSCEKSLALLKTVIIVLSAFIACWSPLFILLLLDVACEVRGCPILYRSEWFLALAVLNSAMNPVIYTLTSREMRRAFFRLLCCCCRSATTSKLEPPIGESSRSKSDTSPRPRREEGPESLMSSGNINSSA